MRIDKICINNFGKLSDITLSPKDGLNIIYAPNESGKSTLLAFIKFIFYGTKVKKNKGEMPFKEKYMPWNGMQMSGSIEFSEGGKKYIIYRMEGAKNGAKKLEVRELLTGRDLNITEPGRHFFSVGEKAFSHSCFVTDIFSVTESDDDILSMLSNSGAENASYTRVKNILEEKILSLSSPKRSSSVLTVLGRDYNEQQSKLVSTLKELGETEKDIEFFNKKKETLTREFEQLENDVKSSDIKNLTARYEKLLSAQTQEKENLEILKSQLSSIDTDEIKLVQNSSDRKVLKIISFSSMIFLSAFFLIFDFGIFISPVLLLSGIIGLLYTALSGRKREERKVSLQTPATALKSAIERQIEISQGRLDDISDSVNRFNSEHPDISGSKRESQQTNFFTTDELNGIISRREKCSDELKAINIRLSSLTERLADLHQMAQAYRSSIHNIEDKIGEVNERLEIYHTAMLILDTAFAKTRDEFAPRLCKDALSLLTRVSPDSCQDIVTNEKFETSVRIDNEYKDVAYLSKGTQALVYLALRMAVSSRLSKKEPTPVFFDDVLATFDDERCTKMMNALREFSNYGQVFLCTCRSRETNIPETSGNVSLISLRKDDNNG